MRPWTDIPIQDCGEKIIEIPSPFLLLRPHPYLSFGAPYGDNADPFRLRKGVIIRLFKAQTELQIENPELCFAVFDAWRPINVQAFMVDYSITKECLKRGVSRDDPTQAEEVQEVIDDVKSFWAPPTNDPKNPPPHSTGAAIDLTLADLQGAKIDMGGEIDAIGPVSNPGHYMRTAIEQPKSSAHQWHKRRMALAKAMKKGGFVQHPNEWWHFSYGDQMWAWSENVTEAIYGAWNPSSSKSSTA